MDPKTDRISFLIDPQRHLKAKQRIDIACGDPFLKLKDNFISPTSIIEEKHSQLSKTIDKTLLQLPSFGKQKSQIERTIQLIQNQNNQTSGASGLRGQQLS